MKIIIDNTSGLHTFKWRSQKQKQISRENKFLLQNWNMLILLELPACHDHRVPLLCNIRYFPEILYCFSVDLSPVYHYNDMIHFLKIICLLVHSLSFFCQSTETPLVLYLWRTSMDRPGSWKYHIISQLSSFFPILL